MPLKELKSNNNAKIFQLIIICWKIESTASNHPYIYIYQATPKRITFQMAKIPRVIDKIQEAK